ncbi:uncharacterized protein LOC123361480 [Mauremys mutica]|uniref:uncharacterized protein LOC123361480 n=1 Tax=Mauremys mutica TaxID=74926 RepID=UPI001D15AFE0|nr:uncharacterized protein LOC123361480 [Mauremys mutica]
MSARLALVDWLDEGFSSILELGAVSEPCRDPACYRPGQEVAARCPLFKGLNRAHILALSGLDLADLTPASPSPCSTDPPAVSAPAPEGPLDPSTCPAADGTPLMAAEPVAATAGASWLGDELPECNSICDRNSLLRLFPPTLASDTGNNGDLSGLSSERRLQSKDFPNPSGTRNCYQGHLRKLSAVETLHRVFDDLYLIESLLSPSDSSTQPSDGILNIYPENSAFENNAIIQQEELAFQNVQFNQHVCNYHKMNLNGDHEKNCSDFSYCSSQFRVKDGTGIQKEYRETDRARGNPMKNEKQAQAKYSNDLFSPPTNGTWGKVFQDNHLVSKRYEDFTTSRKSQPSNHPLLYFFNQPFTKENRFSGGTNRNPQEAHMQNGQNRFNLGKTCNDIEYESRINPKECSHLLLKTALQHRNVHSPYRGHISLDDKRPAAQELGQLVQQ